MGLPPIVSPQQVSAKQQTGECDAMHIVTHTKNTNSDSQICPMMAEEHKPNASHKTDASSAYSATSKDVQAPLKSIKTTKIPLVIDVPNKEQQEKPSPKKLNNINDDGTHESNSRHQNPLPANLDPRSPPLDTSQQMVPP